MCVCLCERERDRERERERERKRKREEGRSGEKRDMVIWWQMLTDTGETRVKKYMKGKTHLLGKHVL